MVKPSALVKVCERSDRLSLLHIINGGTSNTRAKEFMAMPIGGR
jgi:hypothetical protein